MINYFLTFVEIRTKVTSFFPFIFILGFYLWKFDTPLNIPFAIIFFCAMMLFDMTTTGINSYVAQKKEKNLTYLDSVIKEEMDKNHISDKTNLSIIVVMSLTAIGLSLYLAVNTNIYLFLIGVLCVAIGFCYSHGPLPIYKAPLGEIFAGVTQGFLVPLAFLFSQDIDPYIFFTFSSLTDFNMSINLGYYIGLFLVCSPIILTISNIMLANNISDITQDYQNGRYTLPVVFSKEKAIVIFKLSSLFSILIIILNSLLGLIPIFGLLIAFISPIIYKNTMAFCNNPSKAETFAYSIKNFITTMIFYIIFMWLGVIF